MVLPVCETRTGDGLHPKTVEFWPQKPGEKNLGARNLARILLVALSSSAWAHHSFAMFDTQQTITLDGTLKEFQWTNPHCFLQVLVPAKGVAVEWSVEMSGPADLYRKGWRPGTLKPGDKVTVKIHPTRDGVKGGSYIAASGPDGKALFPEKSTL
jgi:Family of unknown function (DUF6152)